MQPEATSEPKRPSSLLVAGMLYCPRELGISGPASAHPPLLGNTGLLPASLSSRRFPRWVNTKRPLSEQTPSLAR